MDNNARIHALEQAVSSLKSKLLDARKEIKLNKTLATKVTKELEIIKKQLKQINTRMIANENDIRHIGSKR